MEEDGRDVITFELDDGSALDFTVAHEFLFDGAMYAVLQSVSDDGGSMIAEIVDPMGPDEEFIPLPMDRQMEMLEYLKNGLEED